MAGTTHERDFGRKGADAIGAFSFFDGQRSRFNRKILYFHPEN
jgi:hypothetical protein